MAEMAALLPVELEPAFSLQRKKSLQGGSGLIGMAVPAFGLLVLVMLPMKCQSAGDLSASNPCLLRIGPGRDALAQLFVGKARPEVLFPPLLNFQ